LPLLHVGTTGLPLLGGALGQAKRSEEIDGTAANQWQAGPGRNQAGRDGDVQDRRWPDPSGRVRPGAARGQAVRRLQVPAPHITKVGDACTVTFPKPAPIRSSARCYAQGMKGVITVGSGGGSGPTTTAASGAGSNVALVTTPKAAVPWSAGKPAIYWAGWGLFAVGALLALMLIALYVRFTPGFNRQKRLEEGGSPASHCQQGSPLRA